MVWPFQAPPESPEDPQEPAEGPQEQKARGLLAAALKARAEGRSKGIWEASKKAATHIERWPTPIKTLQQCFGVPGVSIYLAKIVITEVLSRDLTGDERAYLAGAEAQMARLGRQA